MSQVESNCIEMQRVTRFSETYQPVFETGLDLVSFNLTLNE